MYRIFAYIPVWRGRGMGREGRGISSPGGGVEQGEGAVVIGEARAWWSSTRRGRGQRAALLLLLWAWGRRSSYSLWARASSS
jgi:hypothetical protein